MKATEMIRTIKFVEEHCHGINQMYKSRITYFQSHNKKNRTFCKSFRAY
jgi:hypothetical protein